MFLYRQVLFNYLDQGLQTFLSESHITYYTTVQGPDILCIVIVLRYVTFHKINKFFVNILFIPNQQTAFADG